VLAARADAARAAAGEPALEERALSVVSVATRLAERLRAEELAASRGSAEFQEQAHRRPTVGLRTLAVIAEAAVQRLVA
jgi:hypothetical protein